MFGAVALLALTAGTVVTCKKRQSSSFRSAADYAGGPNMSMCADDPATCHCTLDNEFDTADHKAPPPGTAPEKVKQWFSQCIGQETWYKASGGSGRFHAYMQAQRIGALPDWGLVFHAEARSGRFKHWGAVNDPSCCTPGVECQGKVIHNPDGSQRPVSSLDDTFGWEFCPGDETLLGFVGSGKDYTQSDSACKYDKLADRVKQVYGVDLPKSNSSCHLAFGTSAGAVGFRKFPNPRFNKTRWVAVNGDTASWVNYSRRKPGSGEIDTASYDPSTPRGQKNRIDDGSVEPPYLIGETCGTCHVGFHPANPPENPETPHWDNILFAIGNIYLRMTDIFNAGSAPGTLVGEAFTHTRPGTVDTSAVTNDYVNNPGTFNAIINADQRPGLVLSHNDGLGDAGVNAPTERFCEAVRSYPKLGFEKACGDAGRKKVPHILKGGEDSVGPAGAVQRVYFNIFSCAETCLSNHLDDPRTMSGRNARQTPFDLNQCTRDCPSLGAVFDRIPDIYAFLLKVRPNDLKDSEVGKPVVDVVMAAKDQAGRSLVDRGADVYSKNCARCHSSFPGQSNERVGTFANGVMVDPDTAITKRVLLEDIALPKGTPRRDWLGSDVRIPVQVKDLNTNYCRALHSNHVQGHLWDVYASEDQRAADKYQAYAAEDFEFPREGYTAAGLGGAQNLFQTLQGRGYYRAISLLNAWAHAPFMHNNAVGFDFNHGLPQFKLTSEFNEELVAADPKVAGRLAMYQKSMEILLTPSAQRNGGRQKIEVTRRPINIFVAPSLPELMPTLRQLPNFFQSALGQRYEIVLPAGMPITIIGSLRHKKLLSDFVRAASAGASFSERTRSARAFLARFSQPTAEASINALIQGQYVGCADLPEDRGHEFGTSLAGDDKKALIEFMKLL